MLEIKNLSIIYKKDEQIVKAVNNVNLRLENSKTLGLVGESGSGKSTVALSILKLLPPNSEITAGEILWGGVDILRLGNGHLRDLRGGEIAMIFQDPFSSLNPVFTVGDQIGEAVALHQRETGKGKRPACRRGREKVLELLELVHLKADVIGKYPHELSGGMRQRAMIAMALAGNPKLLIADEPITALDVTIQAEILKLLKEIQAKMGMSVILITHNLALVYGFCDRVLIMKEGNIVEEGGIEEVFKGPKTQYTRELIDAIPKPKWSKNA